MLFFIRATVHQGNLTNNQLWELWEKEIELGLRAIKAGKIKNAYKVSGSKEVILIYDADSHDELDKVFTSQLPLSDFINIKEMIPIRTYESFGEDVKNRWKN